MKKISLIFLLLMSFFVRAADHQAQDKTFPQMVDECDGAMRNISKHWCCCEGVYAFGTCCPWFFPGINDYVQLTGHLKYLRREQECGSVGIGVVRRVHEEAMQEHADVAALLTED